jgi:5-methylthioribose kinase
MNRPPESSPSHALDRYMPSNYQPLTLHSLPAWLGSISSLRSRLGVDISQLRISEVGDGNLNMVFRVEGPSTDLIVKQALPYVRLVGDSWPLPLSRSYFEHMALLHQAKQSPAHVPEVFYFDAEQAAIVMQLLKPHIILRKGLIAGMEYPGLAQHLASFMARTLYFGSVLHLSGQDYKAMQAAFAPNHALCKITEDLVFTEPYFNAPLNRWTSPQLDSVVASLRSDSALKMMAQHYKARFIGDAQALIHGDLHTGSIMVAQGDTRVIDPEFAFMGPIGFDVGALLANLIMAWFSQSVHRSEPSVRSAYRAWIAEQMTQIWDEFSGLFCKLWLGDAQRQVPSDSLVSSAKDEAAFVQYQERFMQSVFTDSMAFAGLKIIRRVIGLAHVEDFESITDPAARARCEAAALSLARQLVVGAASVQGMGDLLSRMSMAQETVAC